MLYVFCKIICFVWVFLLSLLCDWGTTSWGVLSSWISVFSLLGYICAYSDGHLIHPRRMKYLGVNCGNLIVWTVFGQTIKVCKNGATGGSSRWEERKRTVSKMMIWLELLSRLNSKQSVKLVLIMCLCSLCLFTTTNLENVWVIWDLQWRICSLPFATFHWL